MLSLRSHSRSSAPVKPIFRGDSQRRMVRRPTARRKLWVEALEHRQLLAADIQFQGEAVWVEEGPGPITGGLTDVGDASAVAGAVIGVAVHPTNTNQVYLASVNGGVWRTMNFAAASPAWTPMTDFLPSLAIGAIAVSELNPNLVVAGTGSFTNGAFGAAPSAGIYLSTNGFAADPSAVQWTHIPQTVFARRAVNAIALSRANADNLLIATNGGAFRSTTGGLPSPTGAPAFSRVPDISNSPTGLPIANVTDIQMDPGPSAADRARVYAAVVGQGIYRSDDDGANWTIVSAGIPNAFLADSIKLAVHTSVVDGVESHVLYAGLIKGMPGSFGTRGQLSGIYRSTDFGATWTDMAVPFSGERLNDGSDNDQDGLTDGDDPDADSGLHPGNQGVRNFSMVAHPTNPHVVYVGGDRQPVASGNATGCNSFYARLYMGTTANGFPQWTPIVCDFANDTAPHADTRDMHFLNANTLIETSDGGIYVLSSPATTANTNSGTWQSRNGDLRITEVNSVAYSSPEDIYITGNQDNGVTYQVTPGSLTWKHYRGGDGMIQVTVPGTDVGYSLTNNFNGFAKIKLEANEELDISIRPLGLGVGNARLRGLRKVDRSFSGAAFIPMQPNRFDESQLLIGYNGLYHTRNGGLTVITLEEPPANGNLISSLAFGGKEIDGNGQSVEVPDVYYAVRGLDVTRSFVNLERKGDQSQRVTSTLPGWWIDDLVVNPDNWKVAYVVGGNDLFTTTDGGVTWSTVSGVVPGVTRINSVAIYNPSTSNANDEVLLVGAYEGVYYSLNPRAASPVWHKLGNGLPNAIVTDVHVEDELLYIGTFGRGVWSLDNLGEKLNGVLEVTGTAGDDQITISLSPTDPQMLVITATSPGTTSNTVSLPVNGVRQIVVTGDTGDDRVTVDHSRGFVGFTRGITSQPVDFIVFDGGAGDDTVVVTPDAAGYYEALVTGPDASGTGAVTVRANYGNNASAAQAFGLQSRMSFTNVRSNASGVSTPFPTKTFAGTVGLGLQHVSNFLGSLSIPGTSLGPLRLENLLPGLSGLSAVERTSVMGLPAGPAANVNENIPAFDVSGGEMLRRFFETSDAALLLRDIGTEYSTITELQQRLDQIGDVEVVTEANTTTIHFDATRRVSGSVSMQTPSSGLAHLSGVVHLEADVRLQLSFGVDPQGFFLDTAANPEISINNISGTFKGNGRLGFLDVTVSDGTLELAPDVEIVIDLNSPDPTETTTKLRLNQLNGSLTDLVTMQLVGDADETDAEISLSGHFRAALFNFPILQDAQLSLEWPTVADPLQFTVKPVEGTTGARILDLMTTNAQQIRAGLQSLNSAISQLTNIDLLDTPIPLVNQSIAEILEGTPRDVVLSSADVAFVDEIVETESHKSFEVALSSNNPQNVGLRQNAAVYYFSGGVEVQGQITSVDADHFTVRFSADADQTPDQDTTFRFERGGGLSNILDNLTSGLKDNLPTLQEVISYLADVTGVDLINELEIVGQGSDLALEFPLTYDPDPLVFQRRLDFAEAIGGLKLDSSSELLVSVDPLLQVKVGVRLGSGDSSLNLSDRFYIVASDPQSPEPALSLKVTATLDDPNSSDDVPLLQGTLGFLDVSLGEAPSSQEETAISIVATLGVHLTEASASANGDGRITISELGLNTFNPQFSADFQIPGLVLAANVGDATLGTVSVVLDQQISSLSQLPDVLSALVDNLDLQSDFERYLDFNNITPDMVLAAVQLLLDHLDRLGGGTVMETDLPLVNRSISDLVDLGQILLDKIGTLGDVQTEGDTTASVVGTAAKLEAFLNSRLAPNLQPGETPPVRVMVDADAIRFSLEISDRDRFDTSLPFAFSLGSTAQFGPGFGLASLSGEGALQLDVDAGARLTFGLLTSGGIPSINELQQRLFFDTTGDQATGISVAIAANAGYDLNGDGNPDAPPMSFEAAVGPLRVTVPDARALIRIELEGQVLDGGNHGEGPGRLTIQELLSATAMDDVIDITFVEDSVQARIPLDGFEDANGDGIDDNTTVAADPNFLSPGDGLVEVGGLLRNLGSPTFNTDLAAHRSEVDIAIPLSQQELATGDFRIFAHNLSGLVSSQLLSFDSLFTGLQQFLTWGQNLLGIDVFDFKLPLIGVTIGDAFDFFNNEIAACSPENASTLRDVVSCVIAAGIGPADSSDALIAAATVVANVLANVAHVEPLTDLDGDGQVASKVGPDDRMLGNDILKVDRGVETTPVTIFNTSVVLVGPANASFSATQLNSNMRRSGIAIGDVVHYSSTNGSQQTARVISVSENQFVAEMNDPQLPPVTSTATDLVVDTRAIVGISFLAKFAPQIERTFAGLDLGSDFLRFSADPEVTFHGALTMLLGFGVNKTDGFFIKTDFLDVDTDPNTPGIQPPFGEIDSDLTVPGIQPPAGRLLALDGSVSLDGGFEVDLGFLRFDAEFSEGATPQQDDSLPEDDFLSLGFAVDVHDPTTAQNGAPSVGRLTADELLNFSQLPSMIDGQFLVQAGVNVPLSLSSSSQLPSIGANFVLDWSNSGQPFNVFDDIPSVEIGLENIQLNAGSFLDTVVTPFLTNLKEKTPLGPIAELMTEPLPVLNKTIYEILRPTIQDEKKLKAFDFLFKIANFINQAGSLDASDQTINYGDVSLSAIEQPSPKFGSIAAILGGNRPIATPVTDPNEGESFPDGEGAPADAAEDAPGANLPVIGSFIEGLAEIGIRFPVLRLSSLSQLLIGNDVDLVTVSLEPLSVCFRFGGSCDEPGSGGISFPIFNFGIPFIADVNIEATFAGEFEFAANVAGGFDTRGIRAGNFLHGFYLGDFNPGSDGIIQPSDSERFEIQLGASVSAGVDAQVRLVGLPLGRATGSAGIQAIVGIDLNDDNEDPDTGAVPDSDPRDEQQRHDGRVYIDEIATILQSHPGQPFCLFDLGGELNAFLDVHLEALGVFSKDFNFDWPLADFNLSCATTPPVPSDLGRLQVGPGGTSQLVLTQSSSAFDAQHLAFSATNHPDGDNLQILLIDKNLDPSDGAPVLVVANPTAIDVRANNRFRVRKTDFQDLSELGVQAGQRVQYGVTGGQSFWATVRQVGDSDFEIEPDAGASAPQTSHVITVLSGKETLRLRKSARNNDGTQGVAFEDFGPEESGDNFLASVTSIALIATPDFLTTTLPIAIAPTGFGAGNDSITFDPLITAAGHLSGGLGDDFFITAQGNDILLGGFGDDSLKGGPATHVLRSSGQNIIIGGGGSDLIEGGDQADTLVGDYDFSYDRRPLFDIPFVSGDLEGNDSITAGDGDDFIWGDNRGVAQFGSAPPEIADGPEPIAGGGTSFLHDSIYAGGGSDVVFAGPGDDTVFGDDTGSLGDATGGDDFIFGGLGHDRVNGGFGDDTIIGWFGNDHLQGDSGDDHLHGGNDNPGDVVPGMGMDVLIGDGLLSTPTGATVVTDGGRDILDASDSNSACVYGGLLDDVIVGSTGADCLGGGPGDDSIIGGPKSDRIDTGSGDDRVVTGSGLINGFGFVPGIAATLDFNRGIDIIREKLIEGDLVEFGSGSINTIDGISTVIPDVGLPSVGSIGNFATTSSPVTAHLGTDVLGLNNLNQLTQSVKTSRVTGRMDKFVGSSFADVISVAPLTSAARSIDGGTNRVGVVDTVAFNAVGRSVRILPDRVATEGLGDVSFRSIGQIELQNVGDSITLFVGDRPDELTLFRESEERLGVRRTDGTVTLFSDAVALTIQGDGFDDVLTIDYSRGNPIPRGGLTFIGRDHDTSQGDIVRIIGTGSESVELRLESIEGAFTHYTSDGLPVTLAAVELITLEQLKAITLSTRESEDNLILDDTLELNRVRRNRLYGTADAVSIIPVSWSDVPQVTIDLGSSDRESLHDTMTLEGDAVLGNGMSDLILLTGQGRDDITIRLSSFALPVERGVFSIDLADDHGSVVIDADMDLAVRGTEVFDARENVLTFTNATATNLRFIGGPSVNSYSVANWPGPMEVDGGSGADLLSLEMTGGLFTALESLTLTSPVRTNPSSQAATIRGSLNLGAQTQTWVVGNGTANPDLRVDAILSGNAGLTKSGAGTMQLTADNSYTGTTTVTAGQFVVDGRQSQSRVTLNGGSLTGLGSVGAITVNSGDISPGNPVGLLTGNGNVSVSSTGSMGFALGGIQPRTQYDQLSVIGRVGLVGPLQVSLSFLPPVGTVFTLITNDSTDAITGSFAGLPEGATFTTGGATLRVSYRGGTGNDVTLTTIANTAPRLPSRAITPLIAEGGTATLTGEISEPDVGDLFFLEINWGDGSPQETYTFPFGTTSINIPHIYHDDVPGATLEDGYHVALRWFDQHGAENSDVLSVRVSNVAPTVTTIPELEVTAGDLLYYVGSYFDPGSDQWTGTVDFHDGGGAVEVSRFGDKQFTFHRQFTDAGLYEATVTIADDDGGSGSESFLVIVWPVGGAIPGDANLDGFVDAHDFNIWNVNKFQSNRTWFQGDFNDDGHVDVSDLNVWLQNRFSGNGYPAASEMSRTYPRAPRRANITNNELFAEFNSNTRPRHRTLATSHTADERAMCCDFTTISSPNSTAMSALERRRASSQLKLAATSRRRMPLHDSTRESDLADLLEVCTTQADVTMVDDYFATIQL